MDKADQHDFDSHYEYWDKIKGGDMKGGATNNPGQPRPRYMPWPTAKKRRFIDITHDAQGRMCRVYWDPEKQETIFEPIDSE